MRITFIAVQSINGFITRRNEPGAGFASPDDSNWFGGFLKRMDLVLMGRRTYEASRTFIRGRAAEGPPRWVFTREPERFQEDRIPETLEFLRLDRTSFLKAVADKGFRRIALCGGPALSSWFFGHALVDDLYLTVEPFLFTGGTPLLRTTREVACSLQSVKSLSQQTILLHYQVTSTEQSPE
ncbi:MAG TPA: dihydrofolate reductase family protein [Oceanipulchritudo sp.]|nr:dihydrofolate reductase family protein [Oceanipulchritudo sp.]